MTSKTTQLTKKATALILDTIGDCIINTPVISQLKYEITDYGTIKNVSCVITERYTFALRTIVNKYLFSTTETGYDIVRIE